MESRIENKKIENWKIPEYYYAIQISGLLSIILIGILVYFFPDYFSFLGDTDLFLLFFSILFLYHSLLFILQSLFKKKIIFSLERYGWVFFFFALVYISGGTESHVIFLLIFPLLVSAVDLDANQTALVGVFTILFLNILFLTEINFISGNQAIKHGFTIFVFSIISYYVYKLVKETLSEKYEKEIAKAELEEIKKINALKSEFITVVSHRLRSPISGMRGALSEIASENLSEKERKDLVNGSLEKIEDASLIVNELIQTMELDATNIKIEKINFNLLDLINEIINDLKFQIIKKSNNVKVDMPGNTHVVADRKLFKIALFNIIDNAIKYSPKGNVLINVVENNHLLLEVLDDGIGIPDSDIKNVFHSFYRAKNAVDLEPNESGVGLYSAKRIIELHGGTIQIEKNGKKGTKVSISMKK